MRGGEGGEERGGEGRRGEGRRGEGGEERGGEGRGGEGRGGRGGEGGEGKGGEEREGRGGEGRNRYPTSIRDKTARLCHVSIRTSALIPPTAANHCWVVRTITAPLVRQS